MTNTQPTITDEAKNWDSIPMDICCSSCCDIKPEQNFAVDITAKLGRSMVCNRCVATKGNPKKNALENADALKLDYAARQQLIQEKREVLYAITTGILRPSSRRP